MREPVDAASASATKVDLNSALSAGHDLLIRRSESGEDAKQRRRKDWHTFVVTLYGCTALTAMAVVLMLVSHQTDVQRWAQSIVVAFVGAAAGYYGRGTPRAG